jgi:arabinose-5-phosphate isomerase
MDHLATARRVISEESAALTALAASLDGGFSQAVDTMLAATGRVIVSGMGKSGHIARKIAATLASTGTPAHFVHPAEASHGDLGMMTTGRCGARAVQFGRDAGTGRSGRPHPPLPHSADRRRQPRPQRADGAADVRIVLPALPEACGIGIVPTTSTTMMLALGDALAIALMSTALHARQLPRLPSRRQAGRAAGEGGRPDAPLPQTCPSPRWMWRIAPESRA